MPRPTWCNASSLSGFPTISVDIPLVIPNSPFDVKIKMTKLSEIGAELESAVRLLTMLLIGYIQQAAKRAQ